MNAQQLTLYLLLIRKYCFQFLLLPAVLSLSTYTDAYAQPGEVVLEGYVTDSSRQSIPSASVFLLQKADSVLVRSAITDSNGYFAFRLSPGAGAYVVKVSHVQFSDQYFEAVAGSGPIRCQLSRVAVQLISGVTVISRKPVIERKIDRIVFNVENNNIVTAGGTLWDLLGKTPLVNTNEQGQISISGKKQVLILLNDRLIRLSAEDAANLLRSIAAESVSRIEVITTPPPRYDSEGNAGIISIRTIRSKSDGLITVLRSGYEQSTYARGNGSMDLNYRNKQLNLYAYYSYADGNYLLIDDAQIDYTNSRWNTYNFRKRHQGTHYANAGIDYSISKRTIIGGMFELYRQAKKRNDEATTTILSSLDKIDSFITTDNNISELNNLFSGNLNLAHQFKKQGRTLNIDIDYTSFKSGMDQYINSYSFDQGWVPKVFSLESRSFPDQLVKIGSVKMDIVLPLPENASLETGVKSSFINSESDLLFENRISGIYVNDPGKTNAFTYRERIQAAYASYSKAIRKWQFQAGLRYEYTTTLGRSATLGKDNPNNYGTIFPSAYVQYTKNENQQWNLSYGKRIGRPDYAYLNPFRYYTNPYSYAVGNPFLLPSFTHSVELGFTWKQQYIVNMFFQYVVSPFSQIPRQDNSTNELVYERLNTTNRSNFGASIIAPFKVGAKWTINASADIFSQQESVVFLSSQLRYQQWATAVRVRNTFSFSKKVSAEISTRYTSPVREFIFKVGHTFDLSAGVRVRVLRNTGSVSLNFADIFYTNPPVITVNYFDQKSTYKNKADSRMFRLSFAIRLGKKTVPASRDRQTGNSDERSRTSGQN